MAEKIKDMKKNSDDIIIRYLSNEASEEEVRMVNEKLKTDHSFKTTFFSIKKVIDASEMEKVKDRFNSDHAKKQFYKRIETIRDKKSKTKVMLNYLVRIAAVLLVMIVIWKLVERPSQYEITATETNKKTENMLPDGSRVDLNFSSSIRYHHEFGKQTREINLDGEAFFSVKKNPVPFIVHTQQISIEVTGTEFYVHAYPTRPDIQVHVISGQVVVRSCDKKGTEQQQLTLSKGESLVYHKEKQNMVKQPAFDPNDISWQTGIILFNKTKLTDAVDILEEAYNVDIVIQDPKTGQCLVTADFNHQSLAAIFKMFELIFNIKIEQKGRSYILIGPGC